MKLRWLLPILILLLAACGGTESTDLPSAATNTEAPILIPSETPLPPPTITPLPLPTQTPIPQSSAIIARVAGGTNSFLLVGGSQNGNWISGEEIAGTLTSDQEYQLYSIIEFLGEVQGKELVSEPICGQYFVTLEPLPYSHSAVGITGEWPVLLRTPLEISTDSEIYNQALAAWLVEQAPSMPVVSIDKIWLVDVEGNGTDEVFINATHYAEPSGHDVEPRDYSVVLMRTVVGSDVITVKLVGDYYSGTETNKFPLTYTLEFIGDLNGDGRMEVVVGVSRWEGSGVMVFEIDGTEVQLVLSVMCSL